MNIIPVRRPPPTPTEKQQQLAVQVRELANRISRGEISEVLITAILEDGTIEHIDGPETM